MNEVNINHVITLGLIVMIPLALFIAMWKVFVKAGKPGLGDYRSNLFSCCFLRHYRASLDSSPLVLHPYLRILLINCRH